MRVDARTDAADVDRRRDARTVVGHEEVWDDAAQLLEARDMVVVECFLVDD